MWVEDNARQGKEVRSYRSIRFQVENVDTVDLLPMYVRTVSIDEDFFSCEIWFQISHLTDFRSFHLV